MKKGQVWSSYLYLVIDLFYRKTIALKLWFFLTQSLEYRMLWGFIPKFLMTKKNYFLRIIANLIPKNLLRETSQVLPSLSSKDVLHHIMSFFMPKKSSETSVSVLFKFCFLFKSFSTIFKPRPHFSIALYTFDFASNFVQRSLTGFVYTACPERQYFRLCWLISSHQKLEVRI